EGLDGAADPGAHLEWPGGSASGPVGGLSLHWWSLDHSLRVLCGVGGGHWRLLRRPDLGEEKTGSQGEPGQVLGGCLWWVGLGGRPCAGGGPVAGLDWCPSGGAGGHDPGDGDGLNCWRLVREHGEALSWAQRQQPAAARSWGHSGSGRQYYRCRTRVHLAGDLARLAGVIE